MSEVDFEMKRSQHVLFLVLMILEGVILLGVFLAFPSESQSAGFLGLSALRWAVAAFFLIGIHLGLACLWRLLRDQRFAEGWMEKVQRFTSHGAGYYFSLLISLILFLLCLQLIGFALADRDTPLGAYGIRLMPLMLWVSMFALQIVIWLPIFRSGKWFVNLVAFQPNLRSGLIVLSVLLIVWGFVLATGIGLKPDLIGWYEPGAPLLSAQVWLAWLLFVIFLLMMTALKPDQWQLLDIGIMLLLWLTAFWLWNSQPMLPNFFAPRPGPPTYEFFPYSDAVSYDLTAHRVVLGLKDSALPSKPLYGYFLAALRAIQDGGYEEVVKLQIAVLALFPLLIYGIGSTLHHRASGFLGALLIIFREANAIQLSGLIKVAHVKLLLSDLPTAVYFAFLLWVAAQWLRENDGLDRKHSLYLAFVLGSLSGFSLLLRPQTTILIPVVALFMLWVWRKQPWAMIKAGVLMAGGVFLALSGWFWYSWQHTGFLLLNDPWQTAYMTSVYHLSPNVVDVDVNRLPRRAGETLGEYDARVRRSVAEFTLRYPQVVAQFVSAHFFHNQIESLFALPQSPFWVYQVEPRLLARWQDQTQRLLEDCCSVRTYVKQMPFWKAWNGLLPSETLLPFCFNLAMIALGIGVSWRRQRMITIFALLLNVVYMLSSAMGRQSGWRFILPVDWMVVLFFSVGIAELSFWWLAVTCKSPQLQTVLEIPSVKEAASKPLMVNAHMKHPLTWLLTVLFVLFISWSFNIVEWFVPARYPLKNAAELSAGLNESSKQWLREQGIDLSDSQSWNKAAWTVLEGRILYPRFVRAHQEDVYPPGAVNYLPNENRLVFFLLGPQERWAALSLEKPPTEMKHAVDAVVIGCQRSSFFEALGVILLSQNDQDPILLRAERQLEPCNPLQ